MPEAADPAVSQVADAFAIALEELFRAFGHLPEFPLALLAVLTRHVGYGAASCGVSEEKTVQAVRDAYLAARLKGTN